ncbi:DUF4231 domain-containing protein [Rhizobium sp. CFBP 8762]|uniref:DUF4231 domain-containing protein n=1 Tax=Rhizobium sp. CFBP 8762 TaxID=2775279 RepID=UPI0017874A62|nr:DUF4231 domain-containing protein [Rhizobium sp. CFBP 8762]MBD8554927.1 DUF4231 domain-containing protein [Rhizobium sp. CFBP 8762]
MTEIEFPALFVTADAASNQQQCYYLNLVRGEYGLLFFAACLTLVESENPVFLAIYAFTFVASLVILAWRAHLRPEQGWYKSRALAESVKTLSWRYAMRAHPFNDAETAVATKDFRDTLASLLRSNKQVGEHLARLDATRPQITTTMSAMRNSALSDRKAYYLASRITDQKEWYSRKAKVNSLAAKRWQWIGAGCYIVGVMLVLLHVKFVNVTFPVEPIIVMASAVLGWMQIKKFNELASAYALTAHEIGLAETVITDAETEQDFSKAINEVELVFSREHTQWIARQTAGE